MSLLPVANQPAELPNGQTNGEAKPAVPEINGAPKKPRERQRKPNYAEIHRKPLPLDIHPLPAFHPSNPLSLLRLAYTILSHLVSPPSSHLPEPYTACFSPETRSVHVTDPVAIRALWEQGFFGKGTLSRSEPSWLEREKARLKAVKAGRFGGTAEEVTRKRREDRRAFKLERARVEAKAVLRQRRREAGEDVEEVDEGAKTNAGKVAGVANAAIAVPAENAEEMNEGAHPNAEAVTEDAGAVIAVSAEDDEADQVKGHAVGPSVESNGGPLTASHGPDTEAISSTAANTTVSATAAHAQSETANPITEEQEEPQIDDQEHLQLTLEEAFFLTYGLGALSIFPTSTSPTPLSTPDLLTTFRAHSTFPPTSIMNLAPEDPFMLHYTAYHHYRSLGWVVRPGTKFGVDYLLYNRGPVFSHAEFAVVIMPAYRHAYWKTEQGVRAMKREERKDWWWLHCVNRVQSQVRKTLVVCYVEVPPPRLAVGGEDEETAEMDIGKLLRGYRVREFVVRRWLANRSRD